MAMLREKDSISIVEATWVDGNPCWKVESILQGGLDYRFEVLFTLAEAKAKLKEWLESDIEKEAKIANTETNVQFAL